MEIYDLEETNSTFDLFNKKAEQITRWNHHNIEVQPNIKNLNSIFYNRAVVLEKKLVVKSFMSSTRDFEIEAEGGYSERDGGYVKGTIKWKFGEPDKGETQKGSDRMAKDPGEVNSTDRDKDQDRD